MSRVFAASQTVAGDNHYFHWDELRHRRSPDGLTHEQWWLAIKLARTGMRELPLRDTQGKPFRFGLPTIVLEKLHHIDKELGGHISVTEPSVLSPDTRDRYVIRSLIEEAITSSQLEGAGTTRPVAREMIRTGRPPRDRGEQMILNNYRAMQSIRELRDEPLSPELLFELHRIVTENAIDNTSAVGRYRDETEPVQVIDNDNEVLHTPPPAKELPNRVELMCRFANGQTPSGFVHPVLRAIILHFWLAYDHPFVDGNGRCARSLFYWSMLHETYWLAEFIAISPIIRKSFAKYERAFLYSETDDNDLTYFIIFHLNVLEQAIDQLREYIKQTTERIRRIESLIRSSEAFNHRQLALLSHALRHPNTLYTIRSHMNSHGVVYQTARSDLLDLADRGLLRKAMRNGKYIFTPPGDLEQLLRKHKQD
ncbi:MAG: Fic family protein [Phycisphaerae bacterium]